MQNLAAATTERKSQAASALVATDAEIATLEALPTLSPAQQQQLALLRAQRHTGAGVVAALSALPLSEAAWPSGPQIWPCLRSGASGLVGAAPSVVLAAACRTCLLDKRDPCHPEPPLAAAS